jgi:hypothetical protein
MAGRDDYGGSGRPGSNNSTGGGFSGDRSGGVGGGNASNYGGGGGNIRTASGFNNKDRGQPMGPGGTGFNPNARYANGLQAMMDSIGGKGRGLTTTSMGIIDRRRNSPITPRPVAAVPPSGVPWRPGITSQINWDDPTLQPEVAPAGVDLRDPWAQAYEGQQRRMNAGQWLTRPGTYPGSNTTVVTKQPIVNRPGGSVYDKYVNTPYEGAWNKPGLGGKPYIGR